VPGWYSQFVVTEFQTSDFDEFTSAQQGWDISYRPLGTGKFNGRFLSMSVAGLQIDLEHYNTPIEICGTAPDGGLSCALPLEYSASYNSRGGEVTPQHVDIYGAANEVYALTQPDTRLLSISIAHDILDAQLDSPLVAPLRNHLDEHSILQPDQAAALELRNRCLELVHLGRKGVLPVETNKYLLDEMLGLTSRALDGVQKSPPYYDKRLYKVAHYARDFMLDRKSAPPTITEICAAVDVPERTLHYAFAKVFGVTPKHFLKAQRLFSAHQAFKNPHESRRVSDIATQFGFWELGYFARDYTAMFGELPSVTLLRRYN
jgi:AraC family ethanolamine operon transcriptional activator